MREALIAGYKRPAHTPCRPGPTVPRRASPTAYGKERVAQQPRNVGGPRRALHVRSARQVGGESHASRPEQPWWAGAPGVPYEVSRLKIMEYAPTIGAPNPICRDLDAARQGWLSGCDHAAHLRGRGAAACQHRRRPGNVPGTGCEPGPAGPSAAAA
jgi:hypothetical protein